MNNGAGLRSWLFLLVPPHRLVIPEGLIRRPARPARLQAGIEILRGRFPLATGGAVVSLDGGLR